MSERGLKLLWDARRAAERALRFLGETDIEGYRADEFLRSAVERQLTIMGKPWPCCAATIQRWRAGSPR
jgi:uncharacterized protein with HEPN domain